jgi:hypothetical protein
LPSADSPNICARPRKKREDRARMALTVSVIKMISGRIIKVHGQLHQPEAEDASVEINIGLRFACNRGYVVKSFNSVGWVRLGAL